MASVATQAPLAMPIQGMPVTDQEGMATQNWWRFFLGLYNRNASTVPYLVATSLTATGTTQANALALQSEWNDISSTPANSGVKLSNFGVGLTSTVFNFGGATLKVYPPIGAQIDALGANNPYSLANGATRTFYQLTTTQFRST